MKRLLLALTLLLSSIVVPSVAAVGLTAAHADTDLCGNDLGSGSGNSSGDSSAGIRAFAVAVDPGNASCVGLSGEDADNQVVVGKTLTATIYVDATAPANAVATGYWCYDTPATDGSSPDTFQQIPGTSSTVAPAGLSTVTYVVAASDKQHSIAYCVDFSDPASVDVTTSLESDPAAVVLVWPSKGNAVIVSTALKVGQVLTASLPEMDPAEDPSQTSIQWFRNSSAIDGANDETYTLTKADVGKRIYFEVSFGLDNYDSQTFDSAAVGPVKNALSTDLFPATPKVTGVAKVGKTLKATAGKWKPTGVSFSYQWYAGKKPIKGATKATLKLTKQQIGKKISVVVTGKKAKFTTSKAVSAATKRVKK